MKLPRPKWRRCLKCNRRFWSEGAHNRLCAKCNRENQHVTVRIPARFVQPGDD